MRHRFTTALLAVAAFMLLAGTATDEIVLGSRAASELGIGVGPGAMHPDPSSAIAASAARTRLPDRLTTGSRSSSTGSST